MVTLYALSSDENGLRCGADGLAYCGQPLVAQSSRTGRFEVCEPGALYKSVLADRAGGIRAVANALNQGKIALAMICAVHLKLPSLTPEEFARVAKYNQNQPRVPKGDEGAGEWAAVGAFIDQHTGGALSAARRYADYLTGSTTAKDLGWTIKDNASTGDPNFKQNFVGPILTKAQQIADHLHVPVQNILALMGVESTWGHSRFAVEGNNLFGMHAPQPLSTFKIKALKSDNYVAGYDSLEDSMDSFEQAYGNIVKGVQNPVKFAQALQDNEDSKFGRYDNGTIKVGYASGIGGTANQLVPIINLIRQK